jgi:phage tail tube protein FII
MENLNNIENAVLKAIIDENQENHQFLNFHFPYLNIKSREYTGVGMYSNFEYSKGFEQSDVNVLLTSLKELTVNNLENELSYVLYITNGKIQFLEIVTNGNDSFYGEIIDFKLT